MFFGIKISLIILVISTCVLQSGSEMFSVLGLGGGEIYYITMKTRLIIGKLLLLGNMVPTAPRMRPCPQCFVLISGRCEQICRPTENQHHEDMTTERFIF